MTATVIDLGAARARRGLPPALDECWTEEDRENERRWKRERAFERYLDEAEALRPWRWRFAASSEAGWATSTDEALRIFEWWRTGRGHPWGTEYRERVRLEMQADRLAKLRRAIRQLRVAEQSGNRHKVRAWRGQLGIAQRELLATLFRFGLRRVDREARELAAPKERIAARLLAAGLLDPA